MKGFVHNLNTPLQNVSFLLEFMRSDIPSLSESELRDYCHDKTKAIYSQFSNISEMIHVIRQLDYMAKEESPIFLGEFTEIIKEVLKFDLFFKHHAELEIDVPEEIKTSVIPGKVFVPVICQLLDNALKALRAADRKELKIIATSNYLRIVDTGCGLEHVDNVEMLFDYGVIMWPDEVTSNNDIVSAGLGLYWIKDVLRSLGCKISLFTEKSSFTVAEISFP